MPGTVFVSMPYTDALNELYDMIELAVRANGMTPVRTDRQPDYRQFVNDEIRRGIRQSRAVVVVLSGTRPCVMHEIGLAQAWDKPVIMLWDGQGELPFNISVNQYIGYSEPLSVGHQLLEALRQEPSRDEQLRWLVAPASLGDITQARFVVSASPISYRKHHRLPGGLAALHETRSDYTGIRGLLQAFGVLFGWDSLPELLDPEDHDVAAPDPDANLYCIGSPKSNCWTSAVLAEMATHWAPSFRFIAERYSPNLFNAKVSIERDGAPYAPNGWDFATSGDRRVRDFGLVVRCPRHGHPTRMAMVLAGRSALGTEAACRLVTDRQQVSKLIAMLPGGQAQRIEHHDNAFWALVSMEAADHGNGVLPTATPTTLNVVEAGFFLRR